jgi:hypothetical protein
MPPRLPLHGRAPGRDKSPARHNGARVLRQTQRPLSRGRPARQIRTRAKFNPQVLFFMDGKFTASRRRHQPEHEKWVLVFTACPAAAVAWPLVRRSRAAQMRFSGLNKCAYRLFCEVTLRIGWKLIQLHIPEHCDGPAFSADVSEQNAIPRTRVAFRRAEIRRKRSL